jgi:hypothetical protein
MSGLSTCGTRTDTILRQTSMIHIGGRVMAIILDKLVQGSPEWFAARVGCVTMGKAGILLTKGKGKTRDTYIIDVASEMASGMAAERVKMRDMERGNVLEPMGRRGYELLTGSTVKEVGLGYLDDMRRISASPDGLMPNKGLEIKCPNPKAHLQTIIEGAAPKKYKPQMQGGMWVFDLDEWDYVSFCPQFKPMPLFIISMTRDEEMIKEISDSAHLAVEEIDAHLRTASMEVTQPMQAICDQALFAIDELYNTEPEIY